MIAEDKVLDKRSTRLVESDDRVVFKQLFEQIEALAKDIDISLLLSAFREAKYNVPSAPTDRGSGDFLKAVREISESALFANAIFYELYDYDPSGIVPGLHRVVDKLESKRNERGQMVTSVVDAFSEARFSMRESPQSQPIKAAA